MKKSYFILIFVIILLFSSCATLGGGSGDKTGTQTEDNTGKGLDINFNLDKSDIETGKVKFDISIDNSGKDEIILTRENFILSTSPKDHEGLNILTQESIDNFYLKVLGENGKITLTQNQELGSASQRLQGSFFVEEDFFKQTYNTKFDILLHANYNYMTNFDNNLQIDFRQNNLMKVLDGGVSQAAPVQINEIKIEEISVDTHIIKYKIKDKGKFGDFSKSRKVNINDIDFKFREESLTDCKAKSNGNYFSYSSGDPLQLNNEIKEIEVECRINLEDIDKNTPTNVKTSGSFSYNYAINIKETISLPRPEDRASNSIWGSEQ